MLAPHDPGVCGQWVPGAGGTPWAHARRLGGDPVRTSGAFAGGRRAVAPPGWAGPGLGRSVERAAEKDLWRASCVTRCFQTARALACFPASPWAQHCHVGPGQRPSGPNGEAGGAPEGGAWGPGQLRMAVTTSCGPGLPFPAAAPAAVASLSLKVALSREMSCRSAARRPELAVSSLHLLTTPASPPLTV